MGRLIRYGLIEIFLVGAMICAIFLPRRDLRSTAQVAGIALDYEDGNIAATFEIYSPSSDQPIGAAKEVVHSKGETLEECVNNASRSIGKRLYLNDVSVLLLSEERSNDLMESMMAFYSEFNNDNMDLPILFAKDQRAGAIFECKGKVLSNEISKSAEIMKKRITVRDFLNGNKETVWIKGEGSYEIVS